LSTRSRNESKAGLISLRGGRQNNLQGVDIDFPLYELTVICGVSGSGKTSLALDTLYAEGQRRFIESFSAYTRQYLQRIEKPRFDSLVNLPSSIAITREQRSRNNRSTVGTASEMLEYLRVVFSKHAELHCYQCQRRVLAYSPKLVMDCLQQLPAARAMIGFEMEWDSKAELAEQLFDLQADGFVRLVAHGKTIHLADSERKDLAEHFQREGKAIVVVDRVQLGRSPNPLERLSQSLETAFDRTDRNGNRGVIVMIESQPEGVEGQVNASDETQDVDGSIYAVHRFSSNLRCEHCKLDYPASEPRLFSFNSPIGACATCEGFGETVAIDMSKVIPDKSISLRAGAIAAWQTPAYAHELEELLGLAGEYDIPVDIPVSEIKPKQWRRIQEGIPEKDFGGLNGFFAWLERKKYKMHIRAFLARWRTYAACETCGGRRLNREALSYRMNGRTFSDLCDLTIAELGRALFEVAAMADQRSSGLQPATEAKSSEVRMWAAEEKSLYMASEPLRQVVARVDYLKSVGLSYVSLSRPMHTLSSGESQRVMMTTLLGSSLVDMLYVFDEPTVGLHPQDTERIADAILGLRDRGNTVILVEHEPHFMRVADRIVEVGPKAGEQGGKITFQGSPDELLLSECETGQYLSGKKVTRRQTRRAEQGWLELYGANGRNLRDLNLRIPLGCLTVMVGPSGSGKSSLVLDTLCPALVVREDEEATNGLPFDKLIGQDKIQSCIAIDQSPVQRSMRSCPATYSKAMDDIRAIFAETSDAKAKRFGAGHFSFNSAVGRCPTCEGLGYTTINMQFMADLHLPCTDCDGKRFQSQVLEVRFRDLTISEVLNLSVSQASLFFRGYSELQDKLKPMQDLGLGYLPLGQSLVALSAGESMRLKLASQLKVGGKGKSQARGNLIVMDEPTTGLHFSDVERLVLAIDRLLERGDSVLVIEHNEQMIRCADHIIELGPGAGENGGNIVAEGDLSTICRSERSVTGRYLQPPSSVSNASSN
jgi:excinuclease ABC subunit A